MVKKTLLSLAIAASAAGMAGCQISSVEDNKVDSNPVVAGTAGTSPSVVAPIFSAGTSDLPVNIDLLFASASATDGTAATSDTTPPVTTAINKLAGFSTTASFYLEFNAALHPDSVVAGQTVLLIELKSSEDDSSIDALDIETIIAANPENPFAEGDDQIAFSGDYSARYVELEDGTHAIQITPSKPLDPKTKYIVAVTNGVKGANGEAVQGSAEYQLLTGNNRLPTEALAPVRTALQAWEQAAGGFLAQATSGAVTQDNLILTSAFTTNGSMDALKAYANPALFVADNVSLAQAEALTDQFAGGQLANIVARNIAVASAGGDPTNPDQLAAVTDEQITGVKALSIYPGQVFGAITSSDIKSLVGSSNKITVNDLVQAPAPRDVKLVSPVAVDGAIDSGRELADDGLDNGSVPDVGASPAAFISGSTDSFTRYYQGRIVLPNFLDKVELTTVLTAEGISEAMRGDEDWSANTAVGAVLDSALGNAAGTTPPKDCANPQDSGEVDDKGKAILNCDGQADASTNVTYRYPFPQPSTENSGVNHAPVLVTMPAAVDYSMGGTNSAGSNCSAVTDFPVVLYVHGITGARTNGLGYAAGLAANCVATVAIDLPLHGIAPQGTDVNGQTVANTLLPFSMETSLAANTSSPWAGVASQLAEGGDTTFVSVEERHGNIDQGATGVRAAMDFDASDMSVSGSSGSAFININNHTRSRDNLRQAVVDLLNLNASLGNLSAELKALPAATGLDLERVYLAGHSLGAIVATTFAAVNNDAEVQAGNSNLNEIQGVILANGGAHVSKLLENSPSYGPTIIGGLEAAGVQQGTASFEKFMYVIQSAIDVVDPANSGLHLAATDTPVVMFNMVGGAALPSDASGISYPDAFKVAGVFLPDHTVPNFDYFANASTNPYAAFAAGLGFAGAEAVTANAPMAGTNGLASVMSLETVNANTSIGDLASPTRVVARFDEGTHSTFANADARDAFNEMLAQSLRLIGGSYATVNTTVLESSN